MASSHSSMSPVVFISFSAKDQELARAIHAFLNNAGIKALKAPEDIAPGTNWAAAITEMIEGCTHMVLVWTSNSMASQEVSKELTLAMQGNAVIIPFRSENLAPEGAWRYHLSQVQWLEAHYMPEGQALEALLRQVGDGYPLVSTTTPAAARPPALTASAIRSPPASTHVYGQDDKNTVLTKKLTAGFLALILGLVGAHKFFLGLTIPGCIYLGGWVVLFVIAGVFGSGPDSPPKTAETIAETIVGGLAILMFGITIAESITYFTRSVDDFNRMNLKGKRPWF